MCRSESVCVCVCVRLAVMTVIPVLSRNTVTSLAHRGTVPHHPLDFFIVIKIISFS